MNKSTNHRRSHKRIEEMRRHDNNQQEVFIYFPDGTLVEIILNDH